MLKRSIAAGALLLAGALAHADDKPAVPEDAGPAIEEAKGAYAAGELNHARRALETAASSVAAKEAAALRAVLPKPLDGWTASDGDITNLGMIALNAGLGFDRTYTNADGASVKIEVLVDSDVVAQMWTALMDPAVATAAGLKIETFNGETGIIDPSNGQITVLVDKRSTFTVSGSAPADVLKGYAQTIDFPAFKAMK